MPEPTRQLTAILFTDIVGFTEMMRQDERKAMNLLYYKRQLIKPILSNHNGKKLKEIGDGTLNSFPSAIQAVRCAIEIQNTLNEIPALNLRIGIHIGDIIQEGDDIFGDGVNIASRIEACADPGGICISQAVYESIQNQIDLNARSIGRKNLKGIETPHELYSLDLNTTDKPVDTNTTTVKHSHNYKSMTTWIAGILFGIFIIFECVNFFSTGNKIDYTNTIAVLPFDNIRNDTNHEWLSNSFSENLTFKISSSTTLKVLDKLTIMNALKQYEPEKAGILEVAPMIGKDINAKFVLIGSFTTVGKDIQITTRLINTQTERVIPLIQERYNIDDPFTIFDDISNKVFERLESL